LDGIVINIDPVIGHLGPFTLRWYGLFFALAIVAGVWLGSREARRKGLNVDQIQSLAMWSVLGGVIGGRLFHILDSWEFYIANPHRMLNVWEGGLAIYGGLIGGVLTGLVYMHWHKLPTWKVLDAAAPGMILGQAVGRLACIPNGDAFGAPTGVPWAFIYTHPMAMVPRELLGVPTHPYAVLRVGLQSRRAGVTVAAAGRL
jgi:phosphatidylglycerol:prolipoprotein diacylglycerol transferase